MSLRDTRIGIECLRHHVINLPFGSHQSLQPPLISFATASAATRCSRSIRTAALPTALLPTPLTWQKNANKPFRTTLLRKRPARFVSTEAQGTKIRCVVAPHSTLHFRGGGLRCSLSSPMFSLMGEGRFEWIRGALGGIFERALFIPPKVPPERRRWGNLRRWLGQGADEWQPAP